MALNVTEHRKTPVPHSTVGCLTLPVPDSYEQQLLDYCNPTPRPLHVAHVSPGSLKAVPLDRVGPHITCLIPQKYARHAVQSPFSPCGWIQTLQAGPAFEH